MERLKRIGRELYHFLTSGLFFKNFLGILGTIAFCLFLTLWWMRCYTKHGESLQVHDYIGMQLEDAVKKAKSRSFNLVVNDSISNPDLPPLQIIDQNPKPLSRVKEDRTIYLRIVKQTLDLVDLPSLVDKNYNYERYKAALERVDLKSKIKQRVYDSKQAPNTILYMFYEGEKIMQKDLEKGKKVPQGSVVEVVITERGGGTVVDMPDVVCMKYSEARFLINSYDLSVGSIIKDETISNQDEAYIWKQAPPFSDAQTIRMGSQIDLYLTQYRPDDCR